MRTKLLNAWYAVRASYWFAPTALTLLAIALSVATLELDAAITARAVRRLGWVYGGGPEGARALLSTVAGSVLGIAGVTFSITMVALTLASTQFGPRILRTFMADTGNQIVLGIFIATFLYCLLILRTVRSGEDESVVPHLSVTVALLLALLNVGVLIYFVHHTAASIQADAVIAAIGRDLRRALRPMLLEPGSEPPRRGAARDEEAPGAPPADAVVVALEREGYIQAIAYEDAVGLARERDLMVRLLRRPGHFVWPGAGVARVWPRERVDDRVAARIRRAFILGEQRTPEQDVEFFVNQLVEVAVRALSPGTNDPFTAIACIDWLGAALVRVARGTIRPAVHRDEAGRPRLAMEATTFGDLLDSAFTQIRQSGRTQLAVMIRLLETIAEIGAQAATEEARAALRRHALLIREESAAARPASDDRVALEARYDRAVAVLGRA